MGQFSDVFDTAFANGIRPPKATIRLIGEMLDARFGALGVSVTDPEFGAVPNSSADQSAKVQAAFDTGRKVHFPAGTYHCHGLTLETDGQLITGEGYLSQIIKNGNGALITSTGDHVTLDGINCFGNGATYSGHNIYATGDHFTMWRSGSSDAAGHAVYATGHHFQHFGTCDRIQTADQSGTGWDLRLGEAGIGKLYHQIIGFYSSQPTGGIWLEDSGSAVVVGGQIGKYKIGNSGAVTAVNGGCTMGARIIGAVTVERSDASFVCNTFSTQTFTVGASTYNVVFDVSNRFADGFSIVNNGNAGNFFQRQVSIADYPTVRTGPDAAFFDVDCMGDDGPRFNQGLSLANNEGIRWRNGADDADLQVLAMASNNHVSTGHTSGFLELLSSNTGVIVNSGASERARFDSTGSHLGGTVAGDYQGTGTPEGAVTAAIGSTFRRQDGGAGTCFYVKESGSGNTGWVAK